VVWSAAFSPDGSKVVTASYDRSARIWRVFRTTQELIDYARSIVPRQLTPEQRKQFFLEAE
jgi:WD40 repeat protein